MIVAYNLKRKDYTNSLCIARLGLKHPAGFTLKRRITTGSRRNGKSETERRMRRRRNKTSRGTGAGVRRSTDEEYRGRQTE